MNPLSNTADDWLPAAPFLKLHPGVRAQVKRVGLRVFAGLGPGDFREVLARLADRLILECRHRVHLDEDVLLFDQLEPPQFVPHDLLAGRYASYALVMRKHAAAGHLFVAGTYRASACSEYEYRFWSVVPVLEPHGHA
jgi:hypothetical protein